MSVREAIEVVENRLTDKGVRVVRLISHMPIEAREAVERWVPDPARRWVKVRAWEDGAHMHHLALRWPARGDLVRWRVWSQGALWERRMVLWKLTKGERISVASLEAARWWARWTGQAASVAWVRHLPAGVGSPAVVAREGEEELIVVEVSWMLRGFVAAGGDPRQGEHWRLVEL